LPFQCKIQQTRTICFVYIRRFRVFYRNRPQKSNQIKLLSSFRRSERIFNNNNNMIVHFISNYNGLMHDTKGKDSHQSARKNSSLRTITFPLCVSFVDLFTHNITVGLKSFFPQPYIECFHFC
jgi:hypothetical protein